MKDKAYEHLINFFLNNEFEYEIQEIKLHKIKQPNSKPSYGALVSTPQFELRLFIAQNNDNILVVNKDISSYELTKIAFDELVEETKKTEEKNIKKLRVYQEKEAKKNPYKKSEALEIRTARRNKML